MPDLMLFHPVVAPLLMLFQVVEKNEVTPFHTSVALLLMPVHMPLIQVVKEFHAVSAPVLMEVHTPEIVVLMPLKTVLAVEEIPFHTPLIHDVKELHKYDFVIMDTRPSLSGENIQVLLANDYTVIPTTTGARSTAGVIRVIEAIKKCNEAVKNCDNKILGIIINQVNVKTAIAKQVIPDLRETHGELVFDTIIPIDEKVKQAEQISEPIGKWDAKTRASVAYEEFAKEVLKRLG